MIASLPLFHRIAGQPVIVLGGGEAAAARRRLVERAGGGVIADIQEGVDRGARLAFVAHDDADACTADALRLRYAGLLVNVTDRPELCDFTVPSVLDRDPVLIAIGTGGASAGLAKALRLRLEQLVPQALGRLASALGEARSRMRTRFPDAGERRRALDAALGESGDLDVLREESAARVDAWLTSAGRGNDARSVEIRLRSNDPEDLTLREARLLGSADAIAHEPGVPAQVLDRARADAARIALLPGGQAPAGRGLTITLRF